MLTQARLLEVLHYNPETGEFFWKHRPDYPGFWNARYAGRKIENIDAYGYRTIRVDGKTHKAHRLAWLYVTGVSPKGEIDHRDGVRTNNKFLNLRDATDAQNAFNAGVRSDNASGFKGVSRRKNGKWYAQINVDGKRKCLGYFDDIGEASRAYRAAATQLHGEFARFL